MYLVATRQTLNIYSKSIQNVVLVRVFVCTDTSEGRVELILHSIHVITMFVGSMVL